MSANNLLTMQSKTNLLKGYLPIPSTKTIDAFEYLHYLGYCWSQKFNYKARQLGNL